MNPNQLHAEVFQACAKLELELENLMHFSCGDVQCAGTCRVLHAYSLAKDAYKTALKAQDLPENLATRTRNWAIGYEDRITQTLPALLRAISSPSLDRVVAGFAAAAEA